MDALQPWLLASGAAVGAGVLGAAIARAWILRRIRGDARTAAAAIEAGATPPDVDDALAPLHVAFLREIEGLKAALEDAAQQRRQMAAEMVRLMQQSDGAVRAKDRLLAATGHDLRQPLQAMDLALEKLQRAAPTGAGRELAQLQAGMRTITEVLDGLLLLSQFDAGTLQAHAGPCALAGLFTELSALQSTQAGAAGVTLHWHAGELVVFSDPGMLASLLGRLVDNAIKATPRGGRVLVAARRRGDHVRIEVRDNGIGIAPVHQPRLFDEFFQVGNPERDARNGFGLGLSIVSRLAALLGTRVELRSRLHGGSCFWLDLPRASAARRPPRALLLDRDQARRDALAAMLASWGYAPEPAEDAARALAALDGTGGSHDALLCTVDGADDPAWAAVARAAERRPQATRIILCPRADRALLDNASRLHAHAMLLPAAPAKLRALLATRSGLNTARDAA